MRWDPPSGTIVNWTTTCPAKVQHMHTPSCPPTKTSASRRNFFGPPYSQLPPIPLGGRIHSGIATICCLEKDSFACRHEAVDPYTCDLPLPHLRPMRFCLSNWCGCSRMR